MFVTNAGPVAVQPVTAILQPALPDPVRGQKQFEEMAIPRHVEGEIYFKQIEKWTLIGKEIETECSTVTDAEVTEFLSVLDTLDFANAPADSVLKSKKLPYIALEALRRGLLHPEHGQTQVATVLNFWAAMQPHQMSLETCDINHPQFSYYLQRELTALGDRTELFLEKVRNLPPSERRFLNVTKESDLPSSNITNALHFNAQFRTFAPRNAIPSVGMMQAYLDALYEDEATTIKPRLYLSTFRQIYDTRRSDICDMMIPTPDKDGKSRCPEKADDFAAPWHLFSYHDFYHACLASAVGKTYRRAGLVAADAIRTYARGAPEQDRDGLKNVAINYVEAEHSLFRRNALTYNKLSDPVLFWITLNLRLLAGEFFPGKHHISSQDTLLSAFKALYNTFVIEQKGPSELNRESFEAAVVFLADKFDYGRPVHKHPIVLFYEYLRETEELGEDPKPASHYSSKIEMEVTILKNPIIRRSNDHQ